MNANEKIEMLKKIHRELGKMIKKLSDKEEQSNPEMLIRIHRLRHKILEFQSNINAKEVPCG